MKKDFVKNFENLDMVLVVLRLIEQKFGNASFKKKF